MKTKNLIIPYVIYPFDLMVSMGESDEQLFGTLKKRLDKSCYDELERLRFKPGGLGRIVMFSGGATCLRTRSIPKTPNDYATLQHEIFHAVEFLLDRIGLPHSIESGEAYAYLIGYVTLEIYKKLSL